MTNSNKNGRPKPSIRTSTSSLPDELNFKSESKTEHRLWIVGITLYNFPSYHQYAYYLLASMKSVLLQSVQRSFFHPRSMVSEVILVRICCNDLEIEEKIYLLKRKAVMTYTNSNIRSYKKKMSLIILSQKSVWMHQATAKQT